MLDGWKEIWNEGDTPVRACLSVAAWNVALIAVAMLPMDASTRNGLLWVGVPPGIAAGWWITLSGLAKRRTEAPDWYPFGPKPKPLPHGPVVLVISTWIVWIGCFFSSFFFGFAASNGSDVTRLMAFIFCGGMALMMSSAALSATRTARYLRGPER